MPLLQKNILRVTCLSWIIIKLMSYKVWLYTDRMFPIIPVFDFLHGLPDYVPAIFYFLSLTGLSLLLVWPQDRRVLLYTTAIILISCTFDFLSWQPWEYQFFFIFLLCALNHNNPIGFYKGLVIMLVCIYFYSGIYKLNGGFLHLVWNKMILKDFLDVPLQFRKNIILYYFGITIPVIETILAFCLLFFKKKKLIAIILICMHFFIITLLSRIGYNYIVIPWNLAMSAFLYLLFFNRAAIFSLNFSEKINVFSWIFFGLLPALGSVGYWPSKFSFSLYSGNEQQLLICCKAENILYNSNKIISKAPKNLNCQDNIIYLSKWSIYETNVLPQSNDWYYEQVKSELELKNPNSVFNLYVQKYPFKNYKKL